MFTIGNKKSFVFLFLISFLAIGLNAQELSKEEVKKWKDLAKEYKKNPAGLKLLSERADGLEAEVNELNAEMGQLQQERSSFQAQLNRKDARIQDLEAQVNQLNMDVSEAQASLATNQAKGSSEIMTSEQVVAGIIFKVQIGAFEKEKDQLDKDLVNSENLKVEDSSQYQKVVVGQFRDYEKAKKLQTELKQMGVKGAWVVSYRDGQRITIKEALGG